MFNMGGGELIVVIILAVLFIKPDKLPEVATSLGRWLAEITRGVNDVRQSVENGLKEKKKIPPTLTLIPSDKEEEKPKS